MKQMYCKRNLPILDIISEVEQIIGLIIEQITLHA